MKTLSDISFFDAHCDTLTCTGGSPLRQNSGHLDLQRLGSYRTAGQLFAIFVDSAGKTEEDCFAACRRFYERFRSEMEKNTDLVMQCRTKADIETAFREHKVAAVLSIEGSELLGCDVEKLALAEQWGVRAVNLTWNHANRNSGSNVEETERGLSAKGRAFVKEAERRRILMDVSHLSEKGFWDLMEIAERPVIASHSNAKALCPHSRNLTDEQVKALVENKGFIGLNYYTEFVGGKKDMDALVAHAEHILALGAEEVLGLGGDWDGCDSLAAGFTGVQDMPLLYEALYRRNYGETLLKKLFSDNLVRVLSV